MIYKMIYPGGGGGGGVIFVLLKGQFQENFLCFSE
jgi:hypothetical protein